MTALISTEINNERDVVVARQRARQIAVLLGFDHQDEIRISTAVSELARNIYQYAKNGRVQFGLSIVPRSALVIRAVDDGPGIPHLKDILELRYVSRSGMGVGLLGTRRLMDDFQIESKAGMGTSVEITKFLPQGTQLELPQDVHRITQALVKSAPADFYSELRQQNQELLKAFAELQVSQENLHRLNQELEATNRGVIALNAELDGRSETLRLAAEIKSRFLSSITHELRTPVNSIISLAQLLLDRTDGELTSEQEKQAGYINKAGQTLATLIDDLLDLAKMEAGKMDVRQDVISLNSVFASLRGMLRPLVSRNQTVRLNFEEVDNIPTFISDEGKVSQILRNLISNAIKFTQAGEVTVKASVEQGDRVRIVVKDTGIGIPLHEIGAIFEEFHQVRHDLQLTNQGTGLGLSICKRLSELLGGFIEVKSEVGSGSSFALVLPMGGEKLESTVLTPNMQVDAVTLPHGDCLIIDDEEMSRYVLRNMLLKFGLSSLEASNGIRGLELATTPGVGLIFLDLRMPQLDGFRMVEALKENPATLPIPIIIYTAETLLPSERVRLLRDTVGILNKGRPDSGNGMQNLERLLKLVELGRRRTDCSSEQTKGVSTTR